MDLEKGFLHYATGFIKPTKNILEELLKKSIQKEIGVDNIRQCNEIDEKGRMPYSPKT